MRARERQVLKKILNIGFRLALAAALPVSGAMARDRYTNDRQVVLVTPDGYILDYIPERGSVVTSRDRMGRTILLDNFGNLIATEMPSDSFGSQARYEQFPPAPSAPRGGNNGRYQEQGSVRDFREYRGDGSDIPTGSIPAPGAVSREFLDQPAPDVGNERDLTTGTVPPQQPAGRDIGEQKPVIAPTKRSMYEIAALQVFLDREGISPGVIDGKMGSNVTKAIAAWQEMTGETLDPNNSEDIMERLRLSGGLPIVNYTITAADAAGPYVAAIPDDYGEKAKLTEMSFTSTSEALAERFHMDEDWLKSLNPGVDFTIPGTVIKVIDPGQPKTGSVARIIADKGKKQVFAYDETGHLLAAYPATIGSSDTPSPTGTHSVERIALNPGYTYNPKINFKQGDNDRVLHIPPGPNGPVGTVWIALSKPTYGIHGTPEPSRIGKTNSHGCIRLTNWDATELAKMVKPGVTVEFVD